MKELVKPDESVRADEFRLEDFLPYRLAVASEIISRVMFRQHFGRLGLGMPEWRLIAAIGQHGVLSPTTAGERTAMDKVKVSRAAATLVARGILRQSPDPNDGRGRLLRLTRKGATIYASFASTAAEVESSLSTAVTRSEWTVLQKALGKLIDHGHALLGNTLEDAD